MRLIRSEEHTSELQSRSDLVCRLLLEKKKPRWRGTRLGATAVGAVARNATWRGMERAEGAAQPKALVRLDRGRRSLADRRRGTASTPGLAFRRTAQAARASAPAASRVLPRSCVGQPLHLREGPRIRGEADGPRSRHAPAAVARRLDYSPRERPLLSARMVPLRRRETNGRPLGAVLGLGSDRSRERQGS